MSLVGAGISLPMAMMMPTPNLTVALIVVAVFFIGLPIGSIYAAVQLIFPNQVRGFGSGVVLFIVTLTGLTFGSLLPGLFNDYLFRNEMMVGYSVALTVAVASVAGTITVLLTLRPFFQVSRPAGWLLVPYLLWVAYATLLTVTIWRLNLP